VAVCIYTDALAPAHVGKCDTHTADVFFHRPGISFPDADQETTIPGLFKNMNKTKF